MSAYPRGRSSNEMARVVARKIKSQVVACPEAKLFYSIVEMALIDSVSLTESERNVTSARIYFAGNMPHLALCDVDPDWVRRLLIDFMLPWFRLADNGQVELLLVRKRGSRWYREPFHANCCIENKGET